MATIAVFGAGNIGCYIGGRLAHTGNTVQLIGRAHMADLINAQGLSLSDYTGWAHHFDQNQKNKILKISSDVRDIATATLVLITVKSADTAAAAKAIAPHLARDALIISLQNGLHNAEQLQQLLPQHTVLAGMVPFNVAQQKNAGCAHFHQGTEGCLAVSAAATLEEFLPLFALAGLPLSPQEDMKSVQWAKLLLNLNNAINALSGLPLKEELSQRAYRQAIALAQKEALSLLKKTQQPLAKLTPIPAVWIPFLLTLPDFIFRLAANKMLAIDPLARSSMSDDLMAGKKTEIDFLQGEIIALAAAQKKSAPINTALLNLMIAAENGGKKNWRGDELLAELLAAKKLSINS